MQFALQRTAALITVYQKPPLKPLFAYLKKEKL